MKTFLIILITALSSISMAVEPKWGSYHGQGSLPDLTDSMKRPGETEACSVRIRWIFKNGKILVKSSFDRATSIGYILRPTEDNPQVYEHKDLKDKGVIVTLDLDESGEAKYYHIEFHRLNSAIVTGFHCEINPN